jgi:deoxyadenosine/deoxycytidine kinase
MNLRVEICGGIASGKTTLALLLGEHGFRTALEDFRANPFWEAFYSDIKKYSFETELSFFLQHYHQIKARPPNEAPLACDFSLYLDRAYAKVTLPEGQRRVFGFVHEEAVTHIPPPTLLVHLLCLPSVQRERIRRRGRAAEESITVAYLQNINAALATEIEAASAKIPVLEIDSTCLDFAHDENTRRQIAHGIWTHIKGVINEQ